MSETTILKVDDLNVHARGDGVETMLLAAKHVCGARITTGFTSFPPGREVPVHKHHRLREIQPDNCSRRSQQVALNAALLLMSKLGYLR